MSAVVGAFIALTLVASTMSLTWGARRRGIARQWREILHGTESLTDGTTTIAGRHGSRHVTLVLHRTSGLVQVTMPFGNACVRVGASEDGPHPLDRVRPPNRWLTGDAAFDDDTHVSGDEMHARAMLGARERAAARAFVHPGDETRRWIDFGTIIVEASVKQAEPEWLQRTLKEMSRVADALPRSKERWRKLVERRVVEDPVAGVRLACLRALLGDAAFGRQLQPAAAAHHVKPPRVLREASADPSPEVRLVAAHALGTPGFPVLEALALDGSVPTDLRVSALESHPTIPAVKLRPLLSSPDPALRVFCIERLALRRAPGDIDELLRAAPGGDARCAELLASHLLASGDPRAEEALLRLVATGVKAPSLQALRERAVGRVDVASDGLGGAISLDERGGDLSESP